MTKTAWNWKIWWTSSWIDCLGKKIYYLLTLLHGAPKLLVCY